MSKALVTTILCAVACAFPVAAQTDSLGVTVQLNSAPLIHRSPVGWPAAAQTGAGGTVVVRLTLDAAGEVTDATILSGPDDFRKPVLQSVLEWHFDKSVGSTSPIVNVSFEPKLTPVARPAMAPQAQPALANRQPVAPSSTIDAIDVLGLSDAAKASVLAQLPIHVGDPYSAQMMVQTREAAQQFDRHLQVSWSISTSGARAVQISARPLSASGVPASIPAGAMRIGANVQQANLLSQVRPEYPPLAKAAGVQGTVSFNATISPEGNMADLQVISGPPLLIAAAMNAVKQWTYKPTLLNGQPVTVVTTIDVNFTLATAPPAAQ